MATKKTTNDAEQKKTTRRSRRTTSVNNTAVVKKIEQRSDEIITSLDAQVKGVISNIEMLYNTILDLKDRGEYQKIARLNMAQEENFARLDALDEKIGNEIRKKYQVDDWGVTASKRQREIKPIDQTDMFLKAFNESQREEKEVMKEAEVIDTDSFKNMAMDDIDEIYDVLNLPSEGQCYPHKKNKIAVSYLTATDENFITSPNLYRDGLITDCLLHRKIVDKTFDVDNLVSGDADAVLYFLRVSSYGADFPATFTDPETNKQFSTVIDLGQIKTKEFKLIGDENGWFDFELPVSKDKVKFRYLTKKDERKLDKMNQVSGNSVRGTELKSIVSYLDSFLEGDTASLEDTERIQIEDCMDTIEAVADRIIDENGLPVNKIITNRLEMSVMSINGNTDKEYIRKYVSHMIAKDSLELRRYMLENAPGLDFNIKIERPESLGGGLIETFLEWGDTIFLSIA